MIQYHPLIESPGDLSLSILWNEDWTDNRNLHDIIYGLAGLFFHNKHKD